MTRPTGCCTFRAHQRSGVWSVTKDEAFYGDYLTRDQALQSARAGARAVECRGGAARVLIGSAGQVVPH